MINIVIPMAGRGSRFAAKNFTTPKPFIPFNGKMMVEHVLDGLRVEDAAYTLIIRKDFEEEQREELARIAARYPVRFVSVDRVTLGAACTSLAAHRIINDGTPVLFADSDNIFHSADIAALVADARARGLDGSLLTIPSDRPSYSYAKLGEDGLVVATKEKEVISSHAIAGAYFFTRGADFVDHAIDMLIYGDMDKNEYYMSKVFDIMIRKGGKIGIHEIPTDHFCCVGTPEQLEDVLKSTP